MVTYYDSYNEGIFHQLYILQKDQQSETEKFHSSPFGLTFSQFYFLLHTIRSDFT